MIGSILALRCPFDPLFALCVCVHGHTFNTCLLLFAFLRGQYNQLVVGVDNLNIQECIPKGLDERGGSHPLCPCEGRIPCALGSYCP